MDLHLIVKYFYRIQRVQEIKFDQKPCHLGSWVPRNIETKGSSFPGNSTRWNQADLKPRRLGTLEPSFLGRPLGNGFQAEQWGRGVRAERFARGLRDQGEVVGAARSGSAMQEVRSSKVRFDEPRGPGSTRKMKMVRPTLSIAARGFNRGEWIVPKNSEPSSSSIQPGSPLSRFELTAQ